MEIKLVHRDTLSVEANVRRVPNGDLILLCTCGGLTEPAIENRTYLFRSYDNGKNWSEPRQLNEEDGRAHYHTETAVIGEKTLVFLSAHNGKFVQWRNYIMESENSGYDWKKRSLDVLPEYAFVRSMVALSDGTLLFPYHAYPITKSQENYGLAHDSYLFRNDVPYIESGLLTTRDGGCRFDRRVAFRTDMEKMKSLGHPRWFWPENTVVEAEPGHLIMLLRVDRSGCLWRSESFDYGATWTDICMTDIPNPSNKPQLLKAEDGRIVLLNTPNAAYGLENRFPLEIWISSDGMKTWEKKIRLSDFPGAYSYANGMIEGNLLYLAFEFNRHDVYFATVDLDRD